MVMLSAFFLASPLVDLQIDLKSVSPDCSVLSSKEEVFKVIEEDNNYNSNIRKLPHYLGVANSYGLHQCRFVIRASSYEQAYAIIQNCVGRINSSVLMQQKVQQGSALFMGGLVSDEEASKYEIHKFIEYASASPDSLFVLYGRELSAT